MTGAIIRGIIIFGGLGMLLGFLNECGFKNGFQLKPTFKIGLIKGAIYGALVGAIFGIMGYNLR